jgi:hypothetical protein
LQQQEEVQVLVEAVVLAELMQAVAKSAVVVAEEV